MGNTHSGLPAQRAAEGFAPPHELVLQTLEFLSWEDRRKVLMLNRHFAALLEQPFTWFWLCSRLAEEHHIYVPSHPLHGSWRATFLHLFPFTLLQGRGAAVTRSSQTPSAAAGGAGAAAGTAAAQAQQPAQPLVLENPWDEESEGQATRSFVVKVYARFREGGADEEESTTVATIPLHQRLAMLRAQHGCSNSEALRLLWARGTVGGDKSRTSASASASSSSVRPALHEGAAAAAAAAVLEEGAAALTGDVAEAGTKAKAKSKLSPLTARKTLGPLGAASVLPADPWEHAFLPEHVTAEKSNSVCSWRSYEHMTPSKGKAGANKENTSAGGSSSSSNGSGCSPLKVQQPVVDAHARVGVLAMRPQQVVVCAPSMGVRTFRFEKVFSPATQQHEVYDTCARHVVADFINGINGCILAYGQTGSGKTFSMFGPNVDVSASLKLSDASGLAPRILADVLAGVQGRRGQFECSLDVSYVEVFGNELNDLLREGAAIGAWHGIAVRHVMEGLASMPVESATDVESLLRKAEGVKRRAATAMNERSSRAHSVLMIRLRQEHRRSGLILDNRLCIADLGGSEQIKKSRVEGDQLIEAVNINLGLLALKSCMTALRRRKTHVPFNDSVLTMLLEDSLAGNSNSMVLITGNLHPSHCAETVNALRFGETCGRVEHEGVVEHTSASDAIAAINQELSELEEEIRRKERWETQVIVRQDAEEGEERIFKTVPVGAEIPRQKYESLLAARQELLGF